MNQYQLNLDKTVNDLRRESAMLRRELAALQAEVINLKNIQQRAARWVSPSRSK